MAYIIFNTKKEAVDREKQLATAGSKAGYWPEGEPYDIGGFVFMHPTQDKGAILIYKFKGLVTPLSEDDIPPLNCEPLFTTAELSRAVEVLSPDWSVDA